MLNLVQSRWKITNIKNNYTRVIDNISRKHDVVEELVIGLQASDNTKNNEMMLETVSKT